MSKVLMPSELTAENGAKSLLVGEFSEITELECGACDKDNDECPVCSGYGTFTYRVHVEWDTIKAIYAMAVKHLGEEVSKTPGLFIQGDTYQGDDK